MQWGGGPLIRGNRAEWELETSFLFIFRDCDVNVMQTKKVHM